MECRRAGAAENKFCNIPGGSRVYKFFNANTMNRTPNTARNRPSMIMIIL